ncbi:hypothetical protein [Neolewinella antarctica]|uniref:Uncharacterized protein n=1 Tax=Neolewinella antarctica TaxID=442734 RepID=A0ABX0XFA5_9BACT|nr:hypothetical protein [Neolewinella antarctica]NJC27916.1 hypothetical protein [Neolewinella antarctica]
MKQPNDWLLPVIIIIERVVGGFDHRTPGWIDRDVEYVYDAFHAFFTIKQTDKEAPEPHAAIQRRKDLIADLILILEMMDADGELDHLTDGRIWSGVQSITTVEGVYVMMFEHLRDSVRYWRTKEGRRGYLSGPILELMGKV